MSKNKNSFNGLVFLAIIALVLGALVLRQYLVQPQEEEKVVLQGAEQQEFESIKETSTTPKEIDNSALEELDEIVDSIDDVDEDLSGLE